MFLKFSFPPLLTTNNTVIEMITAFPRYIGKRETKRQFSYLLVIKSLADKEVRQPRLFMVLGYCGQSRNVYSTVCSSDHLVPFLPGAFVSFFLKSCSAVPQQLKENLPLNIHIHFFRSLNSQYAPLPRGFDKFKIYSNFNK